MATQPRPPTTARLPFDLRMLDTIIKAIDECPPQRADYRWLKLSKGMLEAQAFGPEAEVRQ